MAREDDHLCIPGIGYEPRVLLQSQVFLQQCIRSELVVLPLARRVGSVQPHASHALGIDVQNATAAIRV